MSRRRLLPLFLVLGFGYAFLYVPIVSLIVYSFNESRLVTVWSGFSVKWYGELFHNQKILDAAWLSLRIAILNATLSTIIGTCAALALVRFRRLRTRPLLDGLVLAPLVLPEVMIGLALLLLFVNLENLIGWPQGRGMLTITIAHTSFSISFVTVVMRARLAEFDRSLEEAAMDLGAPPVKTFFLVTLPIITPALLAAWLLAFTLSIDDLIVASFTSGPGASTLPIVVYSSVRLGVSPQINALATLFVLVVGACIGIAGWLLHRREAQRKAPR
jgi:putrescine transport system permease protein